jgi:hypothetical protein
MTVRCVIGAAVFFGWAALLALFILRKRLG